MVKDEIQALLDSIPDDGTRLNTLRRMGLMVLQERPIPHANDDPFT